MITSKTRRSTLAFEKAVAMNHGQKYVLRLYVAGASDRSRQAIRRARQLCAVQLKDRCQLEVIDIYQQPLMARDGQIVATPTLVKEFPQPVRRFIGSLAKVAGLFVAFDLQTKGMTLP